MFNLFYLLGFLAIVALLAVIGANVPWYVLPIVVVGGLLAIIVIGFPGGIAGMAGDLRRHFARSAA